MSYTALAIIIICLAMILSGIFVLRRSAKKFNLSEQELQNIKKRNLAYEKKEQEEDDY